jgi:hypothetical protein
MKRRARSGTGLLLLGLLLAAVILMRLWQAPRSALHEPARPSPRPGSPADRPTSFVAALQEAHRRYHQARDTVNAEREALGQGDLASGREVSDDEWRRRKMALIEEVISNGRGWP